MDEHSLVITTLHIFYGFFFASTVKKSKKVIGGELVDFCSTPAFFDLNGVRNTTYIIDRNSF
jgi:hypothetical protein